MLPESPSRIAQIKCFFLEDDAISLNGRKYPAESVNRLVQSAQVQLSDPNGLPFTCYLSHDDAYMDETRALAGRVVGVGKEESRAFALIDVPDTEAGRDVATLARYKYLQTVSLRAINAELYLNNNEPLPLVGGERLQLEGIDFTSSPGLPGVARIVDVAESHGPMRIREIFQAPEGNLLVEGVSAHVKEQLMTKEERDALLAELRASLQPQQSPSTTSSIEEALRIVQGAGYTAQPPKTAEQLLQEKFDAMQTAFDQKLAEMQVALQHRGPGRRSLVEGSNVEPVKKPYYRKGDYLREQLRSTDVRIGLLDRSRPLPEGLDPERILKELEVEFLGIIDAQQPLDGSVSIEQ